MINIDTYRKMEKDYAPVGSWAVWAKETDSPTSNIDDLSIFKQPDILQILKPNIVFVGLNISRNTIKFPWGNFHDSNPNGKDFKLRHALLGTRWWGGYMTDIIKNFNEVDSANVAKYLRKNPACVKDNVKEFLKEIATLKVENPEIIAIGSAAHDVLIRNLPHQFNVKRIPHYSQWISADKYRIDVMSALSV